MRWRDLLVVPMMILLAVVQLTVLPLAPLGGYTPQLLLLVVLGGGRMLARSMILQATNSKEERGATLIYGAATIAPERVNALVPIAIPHPKTLKPKGLLQTVGLFIMSRHFIYFQMPWSEAATRHRL